jgi:hypothetical protein
MITDDQLRDLAPRAGFAWSDLRLAQGVLNATGDAALARAEILRIICTFASREHILLADYIARHGDCLQRRHKLYRVKLASARVPDAALHAAIVEYNLVAAAFGDVPLIDPTGLAR